MIIGVFIHGQKLKLKSNLFDSYSFLFKAELLEKTAEALFLFTLKVSLARLRIVNFHAVTLIKTLYFLGSLERIIQELHQMQLDASKVKSRIDLSLGLRNIASDRGFRISDNEGLGNCMFYALSEQLEIVKGIKIPHCELRQILVQYLRDNPKLVS